MPGIIAVFLGLGLAVLLFVPFVAIEYRKQGRLTAGRTLLWAGLLIYGFALWTYTLLPLPDPDAIRCVSSQLTPFQFVDDIRSYDTSSIRALITNPAVLQVGLNIALFVPLGFFMRLMWNRGFIATTVAGFLISLAIETTQITGVWGIYPCAYRFFDVDDLFANTLGAFIGGVLSLMFHQYARAKNDGLEPIPTKVTRPRRLVAAFCDVLSYWFISGTIGVGVNAWRLYVRDIPAADLDADLTSHVAVLVTVIVLAIPVLATGRTLGDHAVLVTWQGSTLPVVLSRPLRYLSGIGGLQLLLYAPELAGFLFFLLCSILILAVPDRGGLPGIVTRNRIVDAREQHAHAE